MAGFGIGKPPANATPATAALPTAITPSLAGGNAAMAASALATQSAASRTSAQPGARNASVTRSGTATPIPPGAKPSQAAPYNKTPTTPVPTLPGATPTAPVTPPKSDLDKLYEDMINRAGEQWGITQDLNQSNMAMMQRKASAMQGSMGRSVAGGFAGAMGGAYIGGMNQMNQARAQHENALNALQMSYLKSKQSDQRYEENKAYQEKQDTKSDWANMGPAAQAAAAQAANPDLYAKARAAQEAGIAATGGRGGDAGQYTQEELDADLIQRMMQMGFDPMAG